MSLIMLLIMRNSQYSLFPQLVLGSLIISLKGLSIIILANGFYSYLLFHLDLSFPESPLAVKPHIHFNI